MSMSKRPAESEDRETHGSGEEPSASDHRQAKREQNQKKPPQKRRRKGPGDNKALPIGFKGMKTPQDFFPHWGLRLERISARGSGAGKARKAKKGGGKHERLAGSMFSNKAPESAYASGHSKRRRIQPTDVSGGRSPILGANQSPVESGAVSNHASYSRENRPIPRPLAGLHALPAIQSQGPQVSSSGPYITAPSEGYHSRQTLQAAPLSSFSQNDSNQRSQNSSINHDPRLQIPLPVRVRHSFRPSATLANQSRTTVAQAGDHHDSRLLPASDLSFSNPYLVTVAHNNQPFVSPPSFPQPMLPAENLAPLFSHSEQQYCYQAYPTIQTAQYPALYTLTPSLPSHDTASDSNTVDHSTDNYWAATTFVPSNVHSATYPSTPLSALEVVTSSSLTYGNGLENEQIASLPANDTNATLSLVAPSPSQLQYQADFSRSDSRSSQYTTLTASSLQTSTEGYHTSSSSSAGKIYSDILGESIPYATHVQWYNSSPNESLNFASSMQEGSVSWQTPSAYSNSNFGPAGDASVSPAQWSADVTFWDPQALYQWDNDWSLPQ